MQPLTAHKEQDPVNRSQLEEVCFIGISLLQLAVFICFNGDQVYQ